MKWTDKTFFSSIKAQNYNRIQFHQEDEPVCPSQLKGLSCNFHSKWSLTTSGGARRSRQIEVIRAKNGTKTKKYNNKKLLGSESDRVMSSTKRGAAGSLVFNPLQQFSHCFSFSLRVSCVNKKKSKGKKQIILFSASSQYNLCGGMKISHFRLLFFPRRVVQACLHLQ